jgi:hypothetical protein
MLSSKATLSIQIIKNTLLLNFIINFLSLKFPYALILYVLLGLNTLLSLKQIGLSVV